MIEFPQDEGTESSDPLSEKKDKVRDLKFRNERLDNKKDFFSGGFPMTLNKIEEVDETYSKSSEKIMTDENDNLKLRSPGSKRKPRVGERPKSAGSVTSMRFNYNLRKRTGSYCAFLLPSWLGAGRRPRSAGANLFEIRGADPGALRWCDLRCDSPREDMCFSARSSSRCESRSGSCLSACRSKCRRNQWTLQLSHCGLEPKRSRKCRSTPSLSKSTLEKCKKALSSEKYLCKFKRSLKLLGFELSDFGIFDSGVKSSTRCRPKDTSSSFSTKIKGRSVSLDSLRQAVRKAWMYDGLGRRGWRRRCRRGISHRRLLAQAAYEQWYFKKEKEFMRKREEYRVQRMRIKEDLERELWKKKEKSEEEFKKWLQRKKTKRKEKEEKSAKSSEKTFDRLTKTKEASEKAFIEWKKEKDKEFKKKMKEKQKEEKKKMETERQKLEKKAVAEKVFQQWKIKREENLKTKTKLMIREKNFEESEMRRKREEESQACYEMWKRLKEEEMRQKMKLYRAALRVAEEERLTQVKERIYEAEQAFEEWLDKIDVRRQKLFSNFASYQKKAPWLPV